MPQGPRPRRALVVLVGLLIGAAVLMLVGGAAVPRLAIDLAGGTSVTLTAKPVPGGGSGITPHAMGQAVEIMRQRVNGFGVADAQVTTRGDDTIVVTVPGQGNQKVVDLVGQTALLRFRPVLAEAAPTPIRGHLPLPAQLGDDQVSPDISTAFQKRDCTDPHQRGGDEARPDQVVVACGREGSAKYLLGPVAVEGSHISGAHAGRTPTGATRAVLDAWQVNLAYDAEGTRQFAELTRAVLAQPPPGNHVAIVLDGLVMSAPRVEQVIAGGKATITGHFTRAEATDLADMLRYGALPLSFDKSQINTISPSLGADQLRGGLLAGAIGLGLVALYCLFYYRALGGIAVASLAVAAALTYAWVSLLGVWIDYRLSLAGIAGIIVAVGITADSFVVLFERLRDERREGRTLRSATERAWVRARRTILVADGVSVLAAAVLYLLSVDQVKGFAFTLGLTTVIDVVVVFLFTKPLLTLTARTRQTRESRLSSADPASLAVKRPTAGRLAARIGRFGARLYHGEVSFDFVGSWQRWITISAVVVAVALFGLLARGLTLGVEFQGGAVYQAHQGTASVASVRAALVANGVPEPLVRSLGNGDILVETDQASSSQAQQIQRVVADAVGVPADQVTTDVVGSSWGTDITSKALWSLTVFLALVIVYLWVAFEWRMALSAIVAVLHDLLITVGVYAIIGFTVTPATVVGVLTILGYSLYDTVVVFDKVKENTRGRLAASGRSYGDAVNLAANQTLMRSINTSLIALLPVAGILFVGAGLLGAGTLKDLALALLVGIAAGTYSSLFIAVPLLARLHPQALPNRALGEHRLRARAHASGAMR